LAIFNLNYCRATLGRESPTNASNFDLLRQFEGVVLINAEITNSALQAGVAQQ
jgi:hypothetical protein